MVNFLQKKEFREEFTAHLVSDSKGQSSYSIKASKLLGKIAHRHRIPRLKFKENQCKM